MVRAGARTLRPCDYTVCRFSPEGLGLDSLGVADPSPPKVTIRSSGSAGLPIFPVSYRPIPNASHAAIIQLRYNDRFIVSFGGEHV